MKTVAKKESSLGTINVQGNIYEQFTPDQVLTHNNLNKIVDHFEREGRLSRVFLSGVGIGGGLNITRFDSDSIEIGQGFGITTDGDLIRIQTSEFRFYTDLNDKSDYALFKNKEVFEIHTQEGAGRLNNELPLSSLPNLNQYIVVVYVESFIEDEGLCGGFGCDDSGDKVYANQKFVLIHRSHYDDLISDDTIYKSHNVLAYYDGLPDLCIPRLLLNSTNTVTSQAIHTLYENAILADDLPTQLQAAVLAIIDKLKHRINFEKFGIKVSEIAGLFNALFSQQKLGFRAEDSIQYKYDLLKDLLETYREIRDLLLRVHFECVPAIGSFPKHLLLGTLAESTRLQTRHRFYPSPIVTGNDENLMSIRTLFIKFYNQLKDYHIPVKSSAAIRVTPSNGYAQPLSHRSIPYYYKTKRALVRNWSPMDKDNRKPMLQLGYHRESLKDIPCIQKPLEYSHLGKDFYRIEGHLGKNFKIALANVQRQISNYNLPFEVKAISIGFPVGKLNIEDAKCDTKSFLNLLHAWDQEFNCTADSAINFFREYKVSDIGKNHTTSNVLVKKEEDREARVVARRRGKRKKSKSSKKSRLMILGRAAVKEDSLDNALFTVMKSINPMRFNAAHVESKALEIVRASAQANANREEARLYLEIPLRIISRLGEVKAHFPDDLNDFYQTDKWRLFISALNELDKELRNIILELSKKSDNATFGKKDHDKLYEYYIFELLKVSCYKTKFRWLKSRLEEIRMELYQDLVLSNLITRFPGIEHQAGVPKGGTFLMVYPGSIEGFRKGVGKFSVFRDRVLFDFAVPYMCTSECPPETIVYQQISDASPTLTIDKNLFCFTEGDQVDPIGAEVNPENGRLTSPEGNEFILGDIGNYTIDVTRVPVNVLGKPISFEINGIPVQNEQIVVYKLPKDLVAGYELVKWTDEGLIVKLKAEHALIDKEYFDYNWTRADGTQLDISKETGNTLIAHAGDAFNETIKLVLSVDGAEAECRIEGAVVIKEDRPEIPVSVELAKTLFCAKIGESIPAIPVKVSPEDGKLSSPQGANFIKGNPGNYTFDPNAVPKSQFGKPLKFKVNDKDITDVSVTVYRLPRQIQIKHKLASWRGSNLILNFEANLVNLDHQSYFDYHWSNATGSWTAQSNNRNGVITRTVVTDSRNFREQISLILKPKDPLADCQVKDSRLVVETKNATDLRCETPYKDRIAKFRIGAILTALPARVQQNRKLKTSVIDPMGAVLKVLTARNANFSSITFQQRQIKTINGIRDVLKTKFILNRTLMTQRLHFLRIDEALELMSLEILRCLDDSSARRMSADLDAFFKLTKLATPMLVRLRKKRTKINTTYIREYVPKSPFIKTKFKASMS